MIFFYFSYSKIGPVGIGSMVLFFCYHCYCGRCLSVVIGGERIGEKGEAGYGMAAP